MITLSPTPNEQVPLSSPCVIGREPARDGHVPVTVPDPDFLVSRNHATVVAGTGDTIVVTDLGGVNGTSIRLGDRLVALRAHEETVVTVPCAIVCGDSAVAVAVV